MVLRDECCRAGAAGPWYKNKTSIVALVLFFFVCLSYILSFLEPFREALFMYISIVWWAMLLGLFLGGVIEHFVPEQYITQVLARKRRRTILHAVGLGFFSSACSCGVLALAIQLHKKGAATASIIAFLLASPWANLPLTIILAGFFGLIKTLYIVFAAITIALSTGFIFQFLEKKNFIERNLSTVAYDKDFSIVNDIRERLRGYRLTKDRVVRDMKGVFNGAAALADMVLWWILIGMGLAAFISAYVPENIFQDYMGPSLSGLSVTLVVATILEVCSEGTAPLAFEIFRQTGALGNALVFLMAGVATDYTEIGLLWTNVGRKTAIWLPVIAVPQVILFGWLANILF